MSLQESRVPAYRSGCFNGGRDSRAPLLQSSLSQPSVCSEIVGMENLGVAPADQGTPKNPAKLYLPGLFASAGKVPPSPPASLPASQTSSPPPRPVISAILPSTMW